MNRYLNKLIMYHEIHRLGRSGHSINYISEFLGINWRTVRKYLDMDDRAYDLYLSQQSNRTKELAPYENFVKTKLEQFPSTSASRMHDWLKEFDCNFPVVNPKTVYNFVMWIRQEYNIPKEKHEREYFIVEELPYGKQAQVDFGEYNMRTSTGNRKKVYFFTMVLSRSRYKYVYFSDTPFTSSLAVQAHEKAFEHFKGIPKELVYDQDKVFIHDENSGNLLLTKTFKTYVGQRKFTTYFCRKSDPETKGKVENAVKYVKQNFLYNRPYFDLETLNDEAFAWLNRTANNLPHGKTKLSPFEQWEIEKVHLGSFMPVKIQFDDSMSYTVRRDNTISYKSNLYSLPQGTWKGQNTKVKLAESNGILIIKDLWEKELCKHELCLEKGKTIINNNHKRDKSGKINQVITEVASKFEPPSDAVTYFEQLHLEKPRYIRDQIMLIKQCFDMFPSTIINKTLKFCLENHVINAPDFKTIATKLHTMENPACNTEAMEKNLKTLPESRLNIEKLQPNTSEIIDYESLMSNTN